MDGTAEVGTHEASFDTSGLPAGAYAVRLEAAGAVQTRADAAGRDSTDGPQGQT